VQAVLEAPRLSHNGGTIVELKSYLGLLNYYGKFFHNSGTTLCAPAKVGNMEMGKTAFQKSKQILTSSVIGAL
jgi:hypothetical protein